MVGSQKGQLRGYFKTTASRFLGVSSTHGFVTDTLDLEVRSVENRRLRNECCLHKLCIFSPFYLTS